MPPGPLPSGTLSSRKDPSGERRMALLVPAAGGGGGGAGCRGPWRGGLCGWSVGPPRAVSRWAGCVPRDPQGEARLLRAAGLLGLGLEEGRQHAEYSPLLDRVSPKLYAPFNSGQLSFEKEMDFNEHRLYNCSKCVCIHV